METYVERALTPHLQQLATWFPIVAISGPRQSGKSTLAQIAFPNHYYVNLEDPQTRATALEDPVSFIKNLPSKLIIDEAQYAPELFSVIQVECDKRNECGQYILTGSQNFSMVKRIQQSLAGRVGIARLLPFSRAELANSTPVSIEEFMHKGGYPRLHAHNIPPQVYYPNYLQTYIERDVAGFLDVRNKNAYRKLLGLTAQSTGKLVNYTTLANEADVSILTVKSWLNLLEQSYLLFTLPAFHKNMRKRLTKAPKLYFYDTGLLCHLLGINSVEQLESHPQLGAIYENFIIAETIKRHLNGAREPELYFYRDDSKREIDLLDFTENKNGWAAELKASRMFHSKYATTMRRVCDEIGIAPENRNVIARVETSYLAGVCKVIAANDWTA